MTDEAENDDQAPGEEFVLQALADWLIVRPDEKEVITPGGLILPEMAQQPAQLATVLDVGPDVVGVKTGDGVFYSKFGNTSFEIAGEELLALHAVDVFGVIRR